jgi:hypothetical protein
MQRRGVWGGEDCDGRVVIFRIPGLPSG